VNYRVCVKALELRLLTLLVQQTPPMAAADKTAFQSAVRLARLVVHDLEATLKTAARRHGPPRPRVRPAGLSLSEPRARWAGKHRRQMVDAMLDYIHAHYRRPMQLSDLASALDLNAAYVSDLFSKNLGVTFHRYLEELRLTKAKELLQDPRQRVCEVACAVGYSNPNHFRNVFSARVGLPPSAWRQTSQPGRRG
jgi:transcriptional regulator GlxA family with amidase domain